eukprot:TRINITY_DN12515_c0_g1_i2.p1 TRINITY_DN12515_c0_g1~~TRINITY_DN12515_c0_g1_i2.p1  ORF type:complete len:491 (+),score=107.09 TRINITY_DN12515_c0_g1_i2:579-2051(+)
MGLQTHGDSSEVRQVLVVVAERAQGLKERCAGVSGAADAVCHALRSAFVFATWSPKAGPDGLLSSVIAAVERCSGASNAAIASAFMGLAGQPDTPLSRVCIGALTPLLAQRPTVDMHAVCNVLHGLRQQPSSYPARRLLAVVASKVPLAHDVLTPQGLAEALGGLQRMRETEEVLALMAALLPRVAAVQRPVGGRALTEAIFGLTSMQDSDQSRDLLCTLLPMFGDSPVWSPNDISVALLGLRRQRDTLAARSVVAALIPKVLRSAPFEALNMSSSLFGLCRMSDSVQSRDLLAALLPRACAIPGTFLPREIAQLTFGLQGQADTPAVRGFVALVTERLCHRLGHASSEQMRMSGTQMVQGLVALGESGVAVEGALQAAGRAFPVNSHVHRVAGLPGAPHPARKRRESMTSAELVLGFVLAGVPGMQFNVLHESGIELDILAGRTSVELVSNSQNYEAEGKVRMHAAQARMLKQEYGITQVPVLTSDRLR